MNRRIALRNIAVLIGASAATGLAIDKLGLLPRGAEKSSNKYFSDSDQKLIGEIAEMIIPPTSTPGAIVAGVPSFIEMMLQDCYRKPEQESFQKRIV